MDMPPSLPRTAVSITKLSVGPGLVDLRLVGVCLLALCASIGAAAQTASDSKAEIRITLEEQTGLAVTIYNEDLALVKDRRKVSLPQGKSRLAIRDVSARIQPETALLHSLQKGRSLRVLEQNFNFDLLSPDTLLDKYIGETIRVARTNPATGEETIEQARVLSNNQGVILQYDDRIETAASGRLIFDRVPERLRDRPTLVTHIENARGGMQDIELSYLTGGLSWQADYTAALSADDTTLDLQSWITLTNQSGSPYRDSKVQLVAGDLNRVRQASPRAQVDTMMATMARDEVSEEALLEYHLYTLPRTTDIENKQSKQVSLFTAQRVPVKKNLILEGGGYYYRGHYPNPIGAEKVSVNLQFSNKTSSNLGMPLPKGIVRVYKEDSAGHAQFVGEDRIDHTAKNRPVRLHLGKAFDVSADRIQTDFEKRAASGRYKHALETAYKITLHNAKKKSQTVTVRETLPSDWQILEESQRHQKISANQIEWLLDVPAESSSVLTYRALVRY